MTEETVGRVNETSVAGAAIEITTAQLAYEALRKIIAVEVEEFWVIALGPKKNLLDARMIFRGTVDSCLVHPRDIFRFAVETNASSILIAHNHPSGDRFPSVDDLRFTRQLVRASSLMEIPVIDHLIVTRDGYSSMKREGWCKFEPEKFDWKRASSF